MTNGKCFQWQIFFRKSWYPASDNGYESMTLKESACNAGDLVLIPELGGHGGEEYPLQCSCLENPMNRGAWQAWKESDTPEQLSTAQRQIWSQRGGQRWVGLPLGMCVGECGAGGRSFSCLLAQKAGLSPPTSAASSFQVSFLGPPSQAYWADSFCVFLRTVLPVLPVPSRLPCWGGPGCPSQPDTTQGSAFLPLSLISETLHGPCALLSTFVSRGLRLHIVPPSVWSSQFKYYDLPPRVHGNLIISKVISFASVCYNPQARKRPDPGCLGSRAVRLIYCVKIGAGGHQSPDTQISLWESHFIQTIS